MGDVEVATKAIEPTNTDIAAESPAADVTKPTEAETTVADAEPTENAETEQAVQDNEDFVAKGKVDAVAEGKEDPVAKEKEDSIVEVKKEETVAEDKESGIGNESKEPSKNGEESKVMLNTKRQTDKTKRSNSSKFDPSKLEASNDPKQIRKQVEFYFSDANFPFDKFLWETCGGSENKPMKLKQICTFKRMAHFQPYEDVVAALRDSTFLTVSGELGDELVARKTPYQANQPRSKNELRSVYVKGFGDEEATTQLDIENWAAQFGDFDVVRLRRNADGLFKGSIFIQFDTDETAQKFLALDPKPTWNDQALNIKSKRAYCDEKVEQIRNGDIQPSSAGKKFFEGKNGGKHDAGRGRGHGNGHGHGRGGFSKGNNNQNNRHGRNDGRNGNFRGGRGGGRGNRGGRGAHNGTSGEREEKRSVSDPNRAPIIQSSSPPKKATPPATANKATPKVDSINGKRARDDDGNDSQPPPKKVDTKPEVVAEVA